MEADRLRGAVKDAGFKPGDVRYTLIGKLMEWQGQPAVLVTGSGCPPRCSCEEGRWTLVLQPLPGTPAPFEQARGETGVALDDVAHA